MKIVEKTGLIIDISPNKHSAYKQKLVKDQQLRIVNRNQIIGLDELVNDKTQREYKVKCISQTGILLTIEKAFFFDYYYNIDPMAKKLCSVYLKKQQLINISKEKELKSFIKENSQYIVYDKQRNLENQILPELVSSADKKDGLINHQRSKSIEGIQNKNMLTLEKLNLFNKNKQTMGRSQS